MSVLIQWLFGDTSCLSKEVKPVSLKGNQPWIFIGRTVAETPILWPPDVKSWLIGKDPDAGKDWGQEEKGTTEDEMFGWHLWTWIWANSGRWWRTGKPGVLQFMGLWSQVLLSDWTATTASAVSGWPHLQINVKQNTLALRVSCTWGKKQLNNKMSFCLQAFLLMRQDYAYTWERAPLFLFGVRWPQYLRCTWVKPDFIAFPGQLHLSAKEASLHLLGFSVLRCHCIVF